MSATPTTSNGRNMLKTVPGVFISIFFLWYTFRGISFSQILALRITIPRGSSASSASPSPATPCAVSAGPR